MPDDREHEQHRVADDEPLDQEQAERRDGEAAGEVADDQSDPEGERQSDGDGLLRAEDEGDEANDEAPTRDTNAGDDLSRLVPSVNGKARLTAALGPVTQLQRSECAEETRSAHRPSRFQS